LIYPGQLYLPRPDRLYHILRFRRQRSQVDLTNVGEILAEYGLELLKKPEVPPGPGRSRSLIVHTRQGKKLLKRYKHTVEVPAIIHEHSILLYMAQIDFPSPRLVATPRGETLVRRNEYNYALFDYIEGGFQYHNYFLFPAQVRQFTAAAGEILAILHAKLQDFVPHGYNPNGFKSRQENWWRDLNWYAARLARCIAETRRMSTSPGGTEGAWLLEKADYLQESLHQLGAMLKEAGLPRVIIHGDYGPYNLLFRRNAPAVVLDFEIARLDWRATELVDALQRFSYSRLGFDLDKMKWFLDAYRSRFSLASGELQLLPAVWEFLNVRRCIVHWYHYCDTHDPQRLTQARWNLGLISWMMANQDIFLMRLDTTTKF
jgi:Ser/Thr protein kinase RdoA (MazF antagonist)